MNDSRNHHKFHLPFDLWAVAVLFGLTALVYANTFSVPFLFDDADNITHVDAYHLKSFSLANLWHASTQGFLKHRLAANLSFALNVSLGGGDVRGFHLVNLLVHLATAFMLYRVLVSTLVLASVRKQLQGREREIALVAALIWAVHPVQTNSVTYIVQRMTAMSAFFTITALFCYLRGRLTVISPYRWGWFSACVACGGLGLLSKENAAILPVLVLAYEVYFLGDYQRGRNWRRLLPWLAGGVVLLLMLAMIYLGENMFSSIMAGYAKRDFTLGERLLTEARVIFLYLGLLVLPLPSRLNFCHDMTISHHLFSPPQTALAIFGLLGLAGLAIFLFRRDRLASFAIVWFLISLVIESSVIPLELVFEHRLYLPSAFVFIPPVIYAYRLFPSQIRLPQLLLGCLILFLAVCTWQRNVTWGSPVTFWADVVKKSPNLARGYVNLGRRVEFLGRHEEAARLFRKAIELAPGDARNYVNLGVVCVRLGRFAEAEKLFAHAFEMNPENQLAISNLGNLYTVQNRCDKGIAFFSSALSRPGVDRAAVLAELASASRCLGDMAGAISQARRSLQFDPQQVPVRITLAIALYESGDFDAAMAQFRQAREYGYDVVNLLLNAARHKLAEGRGEEAGKVVRQILAFEPGNREALRLLRVISGRKS